MNQRRVIVSFFLLLFFATSLQAAPERAKGISVHMLPKRVADISRQKWGLRVDYASQLKSEHGQPVLRTTREFLSFVRKQDASVQENGVWIVVSHADAYSGAEKALLEDVKVLCQKEKIPLFVCTASELPNGWKRYDQH